MFPQYHYEALFRSEQYALVDNACREYLFLTEFFKVRGAQAMDIFNQVNFIIVFACICNECGKIEFHKYLYHIQVMGKTLNLMVKNLQSFVDDCYDTIALFICLHLVMRYQLTCHKRAVPALDKYWDNMTLVIWPRYLC